MTSFERMRSALSFSEPDRVPFDLCGTTVTGISRTKLLELLADEGFEQSCTIPDIVQGIGIPSRDFLDSIGVDTCRVGPDRIGAEHMKIAAERGEAVVDQWGVEWKPAEGSPYLNQASVPLGRGEDLADALENWAGPEPDVDYLREVFSIPAAQDSYPVADRDSAGLFEMASRLRGTERFYVDLLVDEGACAELLDRLLEYKLAYWSAALGAMDLPSGGADMAIAEADDYGSDLSLLVSPDLLRRLVFPRLKRLLSSIKSLNPRAKIVFHSCGAIRDIIPDLIECGVDALNPVQYVAAGMGLAALKRDFGRDLAFWGGGVDTHRVLPAGNPSEVEDEVKRNIDIMAPGGGWVFATVHNIQDDVPLENLKAMLRALGKWGGSR
jgi:uroporphyrinogen decarboxylase